MGTENKLCSSSLLGDMITSPNMHKKHQSLFKWKTVPKMVNRKFLMIAALRTPEEELLYSTSKEGMKLILKCTFWRWDTAFFPFVGQIYNFAKESKVRQCLLMLFFYVYKEPMGGNISGKSTVFIVLHFI